ncbi:hypothetical protein N7454_001430 [Penicillium verhagenii]|nr:hypothetical protein N7454_001430 [Penicillium verhagenii]
MIPNPNSFRNATLERKYRVLREEHKELNEKLKTTQKRLDFLQRSFDAQAKELEGFKNAQLLAEEKLCRQTEMLDESRAAFANASQENTSLLIKQLTLQKWIPSWDDDGTRQAMGQLYQSLERWVNSNFPQLIPGHKARNFDCHDDITHGNSCFDTWFEIYNVVSHSIYEKLLCRTLVASDDREFNQKISKIDERIREICPAHVSHQWRSAISKAMSSLCHENLEANCKDYATSASDDYAQFSPTEAAKRVAQLKILMMKFADLKAKLECQADRFEFEWIPTSTAFCEVKMTSFTGDCSKNAVVKRCLAPALFKISSEGDSVLIRQATVTVHVLSEFNDNNEWRW